MIFAPLFITGPVLPSEHLTRISIFKSASSSIVIIIARCVKRLHLKAN